MRTVGLILTFILLVSAPNARATHIVGGEIFYDYLGKDPGGNIRYAVTLKIFRDCGPNTASFDGLPLSPPALLTILGHDGTLIEVRDIGMPDIRIVPPTINSRCVEAPSGVCVEEGIYRDTLVLPPRQGGYLLVYQRCCRNQSIDNLALPGNQGATYHTWIPGPETAEVNSSPRFSDYPPIFLCNDFDFRYTQAATDPDGDRLVYSFTAPLQGMDQCCPAVGSPPCPSTGYCPQSGSAPPYHPVIYQPPFSWVYPAPSSPKLTIDPVSGEMSGAPMSSGQFVVCVAVEEYRGGKLINVHYRDFQFNMANCDGAVSQFLKQDKCQGHEISFTNTSFRAKEFRWDFGVPGVTDDTSSLVSPVYLYPDTGRFLVTLIVNSGDSCSDTSQRIVKVYPPLDLKFNAPGPSCLGTTFAFKAGGSFAPITSFRWHFGDAATPSVSAEKDPDSVFVGQPGSHLIHLAASHFACTDSITDTLFVVAQPTLDVSHNGTYCEPATIDFHNDSKSQKLDLKWSTSAGHRAEGPDVVFTFMNAGTFTTQLIGILEKTCIDTAMVVVTVQKNPVAGFEVNPTMVTVLEPEVTLNSLVSGATQYYYVISDGGQVMGAHGTYRFSGEGSFLITQYVTSSLGCFDSLTRVVNVLPEHRLWIADAFTPGNDGLNDTFGPVILGVSDFRFEIFDRWGNRVFVSTDPALQWDGTENGQTCQQGVYAYRLTCKNRADGRLIDRSGHITLIRAW